MKILIGALFLLMAVAPLCATEYKDPVLSFTYPGTPKISKLPEGGAYEIRYPSVSIRIEVEEGPFLDGAAEQFAQGVSASLKSQPAGGPFVVKEVSEVKAIAFGLNRGFALQALLTEQGGAQAEKYVYWYFSIKEKLVDIELKSLDSKFRPEDYSLIASSLRLH